MNNPFFIPGVVAGMGTFRVTGAAQKMSGLTDPDMKPGVTFGTGEVRWEAHTFYTEHAG